MCKISKWLRLLSLLTLCAAFLWPSLVSGAPITKKGAAPQVQAPAPVTKKQPFTQQQQLKILSAREIREGVTSLSRGQSGTLWISVKVQNATKEKQMFILRPELPKIPGSVQPGRYELEPLETRDFTHRVLRINPGDRSGSFRGVIKLMDQTGRVQLDSTEFTFIVADNRRVEDLKLDAVKITGVRMVYPDVGTNKIIGSVDFLIYISNVGREIFGNPIQLVTDLRTGNVDGTMQVLANSRRELSISSGLRPGERKTVSIRRSWPRSRNTGLWYTIGVQLDAENDEVRSNNYMKYSFIIDTTGKVIASKMVAR